MLFVAAVLAQLYVSVAPVAAQEAGKNWIGPYWNDEIGESYTEIWLSNLGSQTGIASIAFRDTTGGLVAQESAILTVAGTSPVRTQTGNGFLGTAGGEGYLEITSAQPIAVTGVIRSLTGQTFTELTFIEATVTAGAVVDPIPSVPAMTPIVLVLGAIVMFALHLRARRSKSRQA